MEHSHHTKVMVTAMMMLLQAEASSEDTTVAAEEAAKKLRALDPAPVLKGETLSFEAPTNLSVSL